MYDIVLNLTEMQHNDQVVGSRCTTWIGSQVEVRYGRIVVSASCTTRLFGEDLIIFCLVIFNVLS